MLSSIFVFPRVHPRYLPILNSPLSILAQFCETSHYQAIDPTGGSHRKVSFHYLPFFFFHPSPTTSIITLSLLPPLQHQIYHYYHNYISTSTTIKTSHLPLLPPLQHHIYHYFHHYSFTTTTITTSKPLPPLPPLPPLLSLPPLPPLPPLIFCAHPDHH